MKTQAQQLKRAKAKRRAPFEPRFRIKYELPLSDGIPPTIVPIGSAESLLEEAPPAQAAALDGIEVPTGWRLYLVVELNRESLGESGTDALEAFARRIIERWAATKTEVVLDSWEQIRPFMRVRGALRRHDPTRDAVAAAIATLREADERRKDDGGIAPLLAREDREFLSQFSLPARTARGSPVGQPLRTPENEARRDDLIKALQDASDIETARTQLRELKDVLAERGERAVCPECRKQGSILVQAGNPKADGSPGSFQFLVQHSLWGGGYDRHARSRNLRKDIGFEPMMSTGRAK